jgi:ubiquinone/menaquinone biosynthesis C-methylase UbiE
MLNVFRAPLRLLPKADLIKTGPVDHAAWNYSLHLGWLQRARMRLGVDLLPGRVNRLLEIGYGSGILMPELIQHADQLFGIDPHPMHQHVNERLQQYGVQAQLSSGSVEELPYETAYFDRIISISAIEFVPDIHAACYEITRVLAPDGRLVLVTPGSSPILDWGLKLLTGENAKHDYDDRRERLIPTLLQYFDVLRWWKYPPLLNSAICLYHAMELKAKTAQGAVAVQHSEQSKVAV